MKGNAERKLLWLEVMRGLAAVWVLVHHGTQSVNHFVGNLHAAPAISNGFLGVDFFFVLSGFIIAWSSLRLSEAGGGIRDYASARLVRIYVPYLPIGIGMYFLYMALPGLSEGGRSPGTLTTLTLLPTNSPPALSVAWTLVHEVIFYAVFSLWFVSRRVFWGTVTAWAIAIVSAYFLQLPLTRFATFFLSPLNLLFVLGVGIALTHRRWSMPGQAATLAAIAGALIVALEANSITPSRFWIGLGFGMLVFAAGSRRGINVVPPGWLVTLGAASYAVYLVHNPVLSIAVRGVRYLLPAAGPWTAMVLICAAALSAGLLYWYAFERPALRLIRRLIARRPAHQPASLKPS